MRRTQYSHGCKSAPTDIGSYEAGPAVLAAKNGEPWGMTNTPPIVDGSIAPLRDPGWGAKWDEDRFAAMTVEVQ